MPTDLSAYNNHPYNPGGNVLKSILWMYVDACVSKTSLLPFSGLKVWLLRLISAVIGKNLSIKAALNVKYPWFSTVGNETWIGENIWIDSLVMIAIGSNVCLSQGAVLFISSHNYKKNNFRPDHRLHNFRRRRLDRHASHSNQGITAESHAVLTSGS